ncbi:MAG: type III secretion system gatekeeper subunit SctW [Deltaproteobacteria bacterium]|jgi:type III secretion protein W|nr:type III secretion system gatekeeper subunit SctW [Deltaproteobacteria bacterium]
MPIESAQFAERSVFESAKAEAGAGPKAEGLFMGARVTRDDNPMSLLADAAEELTFSLAESEESRLDERKEKAGADKNKRAYDPFVEAARKLAQQADENFGRALNHLERLFKSKNESSLAELMEALGQAQEREGGSSDPADDFVLLTALKDRLGEGHPLSGLMDTALNNLAEQESFAVASGLAVDMAAPDFAELGGGADLRGVYRGAVAGFGSPREALTRLCSDFGPDRLDHGLDFLMTVLGNELSSSGPSMEKAHLKALTGDLAVTRVLGTVRLNCAALLERLDKAHGVKGRMGADELLDAVLAVRDNQYAGMQDFQRIVERTGLPDTEREVLFLQDMLQGLRDLPDLFYEDNDTRLRVQGAAQIALDDAVRREEEELGF